MDDGGEVLRPRQRNPTPARVPFTLPPRLQQMLDRGKAEIARPFVGITTDGTRIDGLFRHEHSGIALESVVEAATKFLAGLTASERATATFPLETPAWQSWSNIHPFLMRHGICLEALDAAGRERALDIMRASLSAAGFKTARDVMRLNEHILEITGKRDEYGEWLYWLSIMGTPSTSEPWGWQIDGHHLIVNALVWGDRIVLTPNFMGSEPVVARSGKYAGTRVFAVEEASGYEFMGCLTPEQRARATIGMALPFDVMTAAFHDNAVMPYQGIRFGDLAPEQRERLDALIGLYVGRIRPGHAEVRHAEVRRHLDDTYFAWIGDWGVASPFYYRVHSPVVLIEFDHQPGIALDNDEHTRRHIHTIVRTPNGNDYGKDLLREHYRAFDHADPASPHRRGTV